jgi:hypothetical protein
MEDKRSIKRSRSPSNEGSSSPSGGSTPPPLPSGSPPTPGSPLEIFSCHPCSPVFGQGGPSEKVPVVDLSSSSDEEGLTPDILRDEEFSKKLFDDLSHNVLGPPNDGNIIILNDSDKEEEKVHEEKTTGTKTMTTFAAVNLASTASNDADDAPGGVENDNSDDRTSDLEAHSGNGGAGLP